MSDAEKRHPSIDRLDSAAIATATLTWAMLGLIAIVPTIVGDRDGGLFISVVAYAILIGFFLLGNIALFATACAWILRIRRDVRKYRWRRGLVPIALIAALFVGTAVIA